MNNACAQIKPPAAVNYDSDDAALEDIFNQMDTAQNTSDDEFGFQECTAGFSTDIAITKDTIPVYEELEKTAMIPDKHCIICLKSDMDLKKLTQHTMTHDLIFAGGEDDAELDDWIEAKDYWDSFPHDSDSENEMSDHISQIEVEEPIFAHQPAPAPAQVRISDSSSDSSSENDPQSQNKKGAIKRDHLTGLRPS